MSQIPAKDRDLLLQAAMRAPTAGNLMSYTIIDVTDQGIKEQQDGSCFEQNPDKAGPVHLAMVERFSSCLLQDIIRDSHAMTMSAYAPTRTSLAFHDGLRPRAIAGTERVCRCNGQRIGNPLF